MKKKVMAVVFAAVLAAGILTGCGNKETDITDDIEIITGDNVEINPEEEKAETENGGNDEMETKGTVAVAAGATPYGEILEQAKPLLAAEGWELEITIFDNYLQANQAVEIGEFDASYIQTLSDLDNFNQEYGAHLVNVGEIHYGMSGISQEAESDPADTSEDGVIVTPNDDAVAHELSDSEAAKTYVNIIAVKEGNEENEGIKALVEVLKSDDIKSFIENTYDGAVVAFE